MTGFTSEVSTAVLALVNCLGTQSAFSVDLGSSVKDFGVMSGLDEEYTSLGTLIGYVLLQLYMSEITKYLTENQIEQIQDAESRQDFDKEYSHNYERRFVGVCLNPSCQWVHVSDSARQTKNQTYVHDDTDLHGCRGGHPCVWDRADEIEEKISYVVSNESSSPDPTDYPQSSRIED